MEMIEGLSELPQLNRLRISSIETPLFRTVVPTNGRPKHPLMPYLHIPMQAGSDLTWHA